MLKKIFGMTCGFWSLLIFFPQVMAIEWEHVKEGYYAIDFFMRKQGYINLGNIATAYARDVVFVKDFLQ